MDASSFLNSPTITLLVGLAGTQEAFVAHESLLTARSDNIAAALKPGHFEESETRVASFIHEDPAVFCLCLNFVYRPADMEQAAKKATWENYDETFTGLCKVYVLVDMLIDEAMKNAVLSQLSTLSDKMFVPPKNQAKDNRTEDGKALRAPPISAIKVVYDGTGHGDGLLSLIVDVMAFYGNGTYATKVLRDASEIPAEFVRELCEEMLDTRATPREHDAIKEELENVKKYLNYAKLRLVSAELRLKAKHKAVAALAHITDQLRIRNGDWRNTHGGHFEMQSRELLNTENSAMQYVAPRNLESKASLTGFDLASRRQRAKRG